MHQGLLLPRPLRQTPENALLEKVKPPKKTTDKSNPAPETADRTGLIVIAGPTASGKTDLALALARALDGEVVSADSCQIYREISAGTAKPVPDADGRVDGIPYHLLDCVSITEAFDAGRYARAARSCIAGIAARGRTPILAGGTGLYIKALLEGLAELPPRDPAARRRLEEEARKLGRAGLHARLARLDPAAAAAIPANNIQRIVRALEVIELTGRAISELWREGRRGSLPAPRAVLRIDRPPEELRVRIAERSRRMWPEMLAEVRGLLERFSGTEPGFQSLGYAEAVACARGELPPQEGLRRLTASTCAYAKRQRTWFRTQLAAQALAGGDPDSMLRSARKIISPHETPKP